MTLNKPIEPDELEKMDALTEVTKSIASILDLDKLLDKVVQVIHQKFHYPFVHIFLVNRVENKIEFRTGSGRRAKKYREQGITFDLNAPKGIIPLAIRTTQVQLVNDVRQSVHYLPSPVSNSQVGAELAIPLVFNREVFGALDVQSAQPDAFTQADVDLLSTLSASISVAIRNAKLYNAEKWHRKVEENLRAVASKLAEHLPLKELFQLIVENAAQILPCDVAAIWQLDENEDGQSDPVQPTMSLTACYSSPDLPSLPSLRLTAQQTWYFAPFKHGQPMIRQSGEHIRTNPDPIADFYQFLPDFSGIAAPISSGGKNLGVLTLHHRTSNRYGPEAQKITSSLAGYAGIAIENERLAQESRDQAWVTTILLQVAKATESITNLGDLTDLIGQLITLLIGGKKGALFLFDEEENAYALHAVFGEEFKALGLKLPIFSLMPAEFEKAVANQQIMAMPSNQSDPALRSLLALDSQETLLLVPLFAHNELLGVLLHANTSPYQDAPPEKVLGRQKFAILQGIAQQMSISIQNINLLEARQEESYISAVLLQVSQAIVASENLSESLERISYILRILAGIEGSAVFEFLPSNGSYVLRHLSSSWLQAYQTHQLMRSPYTAQEIPYLSDAQESQPLTIPSQEFLKTFDLLDSDPFNQNGSVDAPIAMPSDSIYLIFRLALHGENYGVMVCRDPNLPKRQRRIELLSGIAQQISLAIQNEHLEQSRFEQEHMDQELQLARQIQKTFLPEELPNIPGYQLAVDWQTARQVGGDFYDVFETQPGHFGLVIADVSDKGLASALYMSVARTLIRAISLESFSPAQTLERVNMLLQLDSKKGFFVTCVYGILNTSENTLTYCIAGHNPPIFIESHTQSVRTLARGGVALGALETIHLEESQLRFAPGDSLVLYTDGVTEAFNKSDKAYGISRYLRTLQNARSLPPQAILAAIQTDMDKFRRDAPLSDDITQLVIKRAITD